MNHYSILKLCFLSVFILFLFPELNPSYAEAATSVPAPPFHTDEIKNLKLSELQKLIPGFRAIINLNSHGKKGNEKIQEDDGESEIAEMDEQEPDTAALYGRVHPDCVHLLIPIKHDSPKTISKERDKGHCSNSVGFEFQDPGNQFATCVGKPEHNCKTTHRCVSLSSKAYKDEFSLSLKSNYKVPVSFKFMYSDNGEDENSIYRFNCKDFPNEEDPLEYHSPRVNAAAEKERQAANKAQIDAEEASAARQLKEEKAKEVKDLMEKICTNCQTQADLKAAIEANDKLHQMKEFGDEIEKRLLAQEKFNKDTFDKNKKKLQEQTLEVLLNDAARANLEEVFDIEERLKEYAQKHPKETEKIVRLGFKEHAERVIQLEHMNPTRYEQAMELLDTGKQLSSESKTKEELSRYYNELKLSKVVIIAQRGLQRNPEFAKEYTKLLRETEEDAWKYCYGHHAKQDTCADVINLRNEVKTLPQIAQAADAQMGLSQVNVQQALHPELYGQNQGLNPAAMMMNPGMMQPGMVPGNPNPIAPNNPANQQMPIHPGMLAMQPGMQYPGMGMGMNPMGAAYPNPGMNPFNPMAGGMYPGMGVPPYNATMNPMMNPMMGGYNYMNPMMAGGYSGMNPMMNPMGMGAYNPANPMMNPMMGGYNPMNPMMSGGYNPMMSNPMMMNNPSGMMMPH